MAAIDTILFEQFADALNRDLARIGASLRVGRAAPDTPGTIMMLDANGRSLGPLPDSVDAETIKAVEAMLQSGKRAE